MHKEVQGKQLESLGMMINVESGVVRALDKLYWLVFEATLFAITLDRVTAEQMRVVASTWTWVGLVQRATKKVTWP